MIPTVAGLDLLLLPPQAQTEKLLFQIPARRESAYLRARGTVARKARQLRHSLGRGDTVMEMYGTPRERVQDLIESSGLELVAVIRDNRAATWESYTYVARRA